MTFKDPEFDLVEALKKANEGDIHAIRNIIGYIAYQGEDEEDLLERKAEYINKLAELEDPVALIYLAERYRTGENVDRNVKLAIELYEKAAERGVSFGNECIGELYYRGEGVEQSYEKAFEYFTKDEDKKSPVTDYLLGEMYRLGQFVEKNDTVAKEHYLSIIHQDFPKLDSYYGPATFRLAEYSYAKADEGEIDEAWQYIEEARKEIDPDCLTVKGTGITKEMIDDLWIQIFREKENRAEP
jgi:TPR repeat protein